MNLEKLDLSLGESSDNFPSCTPTFTCLRMRQAISFPGPAHNPPFYNDLIVLSGDSLITLQNTINTMMEEQKQLWTKMQLLEQKAAENYNELSDAIKYLPCISKSYQTAKEDFETHIPEKKN